MSPDGAFIVKIAYYLSIYETKGVFYGDIYTIHQASQAKDRD